MRNRRFLGPQLESDLALAVRMHARALGAGEPPPPDADLVLLLVDIDHFKRVNDTHGHPVGDEAIRLVADTILDSCRDVDIAGRYGGEEFAVILPDTGADGARRFCERLRQRVAQESVPVGAQRIAITISLGVAELHERVLDAADWLQRADRGLYLAKQGGRNRSCVFEE